MDLDICGLVGNLKAEQMQLKPNIARPRAHARWHVAATCEEKKSVIARSLFASSCRMRSSGLRLEGSVVNGFNVPCGSQKQEGDSLQWGLDRLWLSCLDWSGAAGMVTGCSHRTDGVVRQLGEFFRGSPEVPAAGGLSSFVADGLGLGCRCGPPVPHLNTSAVLIDVTGSRCGRTRFRERVALSG